MGRKGMRALTFRPGLNAKTVNNYVTVLRRALDMAVADHTLEDNLVRHVRYQRPQTPFPDPFSRDEVEAIIEYMTERYPPSPRPQLRDDDADLRHDASVLRVTTGALRWHAAGHPCSLAGWGAQRHGDGPAASVASTRFIPGFAPEPGPLAGCAALTAEGS